MYPCVVVDAKSKGSEGLGEETRNLTIARMLAFRTTAFFW